ncbi:MAG: hypothetical protein E7600_07695 [Ruminococcaceae bacterium]|nr:hypothetical protein [Oscillospiraceae bacterium]
MAKTEEKTDLVVVETGEKIIVGEFYSERVWKTLLFSSLGAVVLAMLSALFLNTTLCIVMCSISLILSVAGKIISIRDSKVKLEVTKQCIYRKTLLGRHTYLPLNSIRAVDMMWFNSISVRTAVGKFDCILMKNRDEVFMAIKKLLDDKQNSK